MDSVLCFAIFSHIKFLARKIRRPCADLTYYAAVLLDLALWELKLGTLVTPAPGNVHIGYGFYVSFCFQDRSPYG